MSYFHVIFHWLILRYKVLLSVSFHFHADPWSRCCNCLKKDSKVQVQNNITILRVLAWSSAAADETWKEKDGMKKHRKVEDEQTKGNISYMEGVNRKRWRMVEDGEEQWLECFMDTPALSPLWHSSPGLKPQYHKHWCTNARTDTGRNSFVDTNQSVDVSCLPDLAQQTPFPLD